jgi:O-methyltransferase
MTGPPSGAPRRAVPSHLRRRTATALRRVAERVHPQPPAADAGPGAAPAPALQRHTPVDEAQLRYLDVDDVERPQRRVAPWPVEPPPRYRGQLADAFQAELQAQRADVEPGECHWYHEVPLRDGTRIRGGWDLIGGEEHYLGHVDVQGKRVLELGPATGYLTLYLEQQGARVVAFEAGLDACIDLLTYGRDDLPAMQSNAMRFVGEVNNSWWWVKQHYDLQARIAYGNIYDLPDDLGPFDVTVFGAILLHLRDPYRALEQAASCTASTLVIADVVPSQGSPWEDPFSRFNPSPGDPTSWWLHTPAVLRRMVETLGFTNATLTRHLQYVRPAHDVTRPREPVEFFTLVAHRPSV